MVTYLRSFTQRRAMVSRAVARSLVRPLAHLRRADVPVLVSKSQTARFSMLSSHFPMICCYFTAANRNFLTPDGRPTNAGDRRSPPEECQSHLISTICRIIFLALLGAIALPHAFRIALPLRYLIFY